MKSFTGENLKQDIPASLVVFLVALPLCLGVALASGAPIISGIISGIVGGIIVGLLSKSQTSVSGPAAGLTAVVLAAITRLGSFEVFLTAVIIAGFIQIMMGLFRAGSIASYIPSNVIKGLLAAIGIILILKQIPHAIGYDAVPEEDFSFQQSDGENTFTEIFNALNYITPGALIVSFISIAILVYWKKTPLSTFKYLPASLVVVLLSILLNEFVFRYIPALYIESTHLVNLPALDSQSIQSLLHLPLTENFLRTDVWITAFTIAIVASLETLLNIEAVDKLDPQKRNSPPNRELLAQGVGNISAGILGGIPLTSVIVRSSVNIQSGNKSKLSAIFHGIFMLLSVLLLGPVMNMIPLSSLAAILIITGYKLTSLSVFREIYSKGMRQFIPFIITILAIVFTDLLIGVLIGLAVSIFYILLNNFKNPFIKAENKLHIGQVIKIELPNQVSFLNKAAIRNTLWKVPENAKVVIDTCHSDYIDHDILEIIEEFRSVVAPGKNIQLNILTRERDQKVEKQIEFINVLDKKTQQNLNPDLVLELLKEGNLRFTECRTSDKDYQLQAHATSFGQNPMAVIINCIDSRTSPEIIFDAGLGDLLTIRIAGNIINPEIIGSIEIAIEKLGAKLIVVKGHSQCGAISLSLKPHQNKNIGYVTVKIQKAVQMCMESGQTSLSGDAQLECIARKNVDNSIEEILNGSENIRNLVMRKEVGIIGAYHDITSGKVDFGEMLKI